MRIGGDWGTMGGRTILTKIHVAGTSSGKKILYFHLNGCMKKMVRPGTLTKMIFFLGSGPVSFSLYARMQNGKLGVPLLMPRFRS